MAFSFGSSTGSAFGSGSAAGLGTTAFGATAPQSQSQTSFSLFGATQQSQPQQSTFSFPSQPAQPAPAAQAGTPLSADLQQHVQSIVDAYNPRSSHSRFQTFFYNKVDPSTINQYSKPDSVTSKQWAIAQKNNPDPTQYVPVHAVGFNDLHKRIEQQSAATNKMNDTLQTLERTVNDLHSTYVSTVCSTVQSVQQQHKYLQHKLLHVINNITKLQARDTAYLSTELQYKQQCELIQRQVQKNSYYMNKSIEYTDKLHTIQNTINNNASTEQSAELSAEQQNDIYEFLNNHRRALAVTSETVKTDLADVTGMNQYITRQSTQQQQNASQRLLLQ